MSAAPAGLRFNKYITVAARAVRQALKEEERVKADRRGQLNLRYQEWKDGKAGEQVWLAKQEEAGGAAAGSK